MIDTITSNLEMQDVEIFLPRWKDSSSFNMSSMLQSMGITDAFSIYAADFSGMLNEDAASGLFLGNLAHATTISVDEEGTIAASSNTVTAGTLGGVEFKADSPFIYLIRDVPTDTVLFMGRVVTFE